MASTRMYGQLTKDWADKWMAEVQLALDDAIEEIAENGEWITRDNRGWRDDTHSAEESITGYVVGKDDPFKNVNSARWRHAQRHGGGRYNNPPSNYYPVDQETEHFPDERVAVVSGFVHYMKDLEGPGPKYSTMTFETSLDEMVAEVQRILVKNLGQVRA